MGSSSPIFGVKQKMFETTTQFKVGSVSQIIYAGFDMYPRCLKARVLSTPNRFKVLPALQDLDSKRFQWDFNDS